MRIMSIVNVVMLLKNFLFVDDVLYPSTLLSASQLDFECCETNVIAAVTSTYVDMHIVISGS